MDGTRGELRETLAALLSRH